MINIKLQQFCKNLSHQISPQAHRLKNIHMKTLLQLIRIFLLISLRLQCTAELLEDKMTKRHKVTIKERKTGDKSTGVRETVR